MRSTLAMIAVLAATDAAAATLTTTFGTGAGGTGVTDGFADDGPDPETGRRSFYTLLNETGRSLFSSAPAALPDAVQSGGSAILRTSSGYQDIVGTVDTYFQGNLEFFAPERVTLEQARSFDPLPVLKPQTPLTVTSRFSGEIVAESVLAGQNFDFLPNAIDLVTNTGFTNPSPAGIRREDSDFQNLVKLPLPGLRVLSGAVTIDTALQTDTFWRLYEIDMLAVHRDSGETQRRSFINFASSSNAPFDLGRAGWWDLSVEDVRLDILVEGDIDLTLAYGLGYSFGFGCGDARTPTDNGELCVFDGVLNFLENRLPLAGVRSEPDPQLRSPRPQAALFVDAGDVGPGPAPVPLPPSILALMAAIGSLAVAKRAGRTRAAASQA